MQDSCNHTLFTLKICQCQTNWSAVTFPFTVEVLNVCMPFKCTHHQRAYYVCACCVCVGGILCPTIERSSPPPCFLSDVVKKAILDAFQISEGKQCRLWHRYMTNSYEQVKGEQGQRQWHSVQRSVESVREGLWDKKARLCVCWFRVYSSPLSCFAPVVKFLSQAPITSPYYFPPLPAR